MKYYKDSDNQVYAYEDGYENIKEGLTPITEKQAIKIANPPPTKDELVQQGESYRKQLLDEADAVMLDWRTELMLGEISQENKEKLSSWLAYKRDVKGVDVRTDPSTATWPDKPKS